MKEGLMLQFSVPQETPTAQLDLSNTLNPAKAPLDVQIDQRLVEISQVS
jgi:hypothetical protein